MVDRKSEMFSETDDPVDRNDPAYMKFQIGLLETQCNEYQETIRIIEKREIRPVDDLFGTWDSRRFIWNLGNAKQFFE